MSHAIDLIKKFQELSESSLEDIHEAEKSIQEMDHSDAYYLLKSTMREVSSYLREIRSKSKKYILSELYYRQSEFTNENIEEFRKEDMVIDNPKELKPDDEVLAYLPERDLWVRSCFIFYSESEVKVIYKDSKVKVTYEDLTGNIYQIFSNKWVQFKE